MSIHHHVISTGSQGNAVVINHSILVDCGVPFKAIKPFYRDLKLALLTHIHSDHFNSTALRLVSQERPTLRFGCCRWLVEPLLSAGVEASNIDVFEPGVMYGYGICNVIPFKLFHNVPNCGYKIHFPAGKVIYATDTQNLNGISARHYYLYMIEANHDEAEIMQKIADKKAAGEYAYEQQVIKNHLSKNKCNDFIYKNAGPRSEYVYLHCHVDKEGEDERETN
jgi:hypothetical protein